MQVRSVPVARTIVLYGYGVRIFDASGGFTSSLGSGGRYDAIIGQLVGKEEVDYPTVGLSFGMESIMELLRMRTMPEREQAVAVIPIGATVPEALQAAAELRRSGIRTRVELSGRKLKKALASAAAERDPVRRPIGESEAAAGKVQVKDMSEMSATVVDIREAVRLISAVRDA